ncbi:hypothetical protein CVT25_014286 [Psilocybe cyanescens]|uniref:Uncharacterized protein n=1 Tax=Psilocybe cyanescens TaxID=93625 RepID=A0A409WUI0_PSICY|nr:hypothetical protein CVT25_014286 [Psilocybe cyanescens]
MTVPVEIAAAYQITIPHNLPDNGNAVDTVSLETEEGITPIVYSIISSELDKQCDNRTTANIYTLPPPLPIFCDGSAIASDVERTTPLSDSSSKEHARWMVHLAAQLTTTSELSPARGVKTVTIQFIGHHMITDLPVIWPLERRFDFISCMTAMDMISQDNELQWENNLIILLLCQNVRRAWQPQKGSFF